MPVRLKQTRQLSIGATSDRITCNFTAELDTAESIASGTINGFISGSSTGFTFGAVAATTATYTERDTGNTVAAGKAMRWSVSSTTATLPGLRVLEIAFSTSERGPLTREIEFEMV